MKKLRNLFYANVLVSLATLTTSVFAQSQDTISYTNPGKTNTLIFIGIMQSAIILMVIFGYGLKYLKNKPTTKKNPVTIIVPLTFAMLAVQTTKSYAFCQVFCVAGISAGLGLSRYYGIDDTIVSVWIGGMLLYMTYWLNDFLERKKKFSSVYSKVIVAILTFGLVILPMYFTGMLGHPANALWGIDKIVIGTFIGSAFYALGNIFNDWITAFHKGKVYFPFQKAAIPLTFLNLACLYFFFIIY